MPTTAGAHQTIAVGAVAPSDHFPLDDLESLEHFPPLTERRNALRLEHLLIHHHFLLRHTLNVRRVLVQSERAVPSRDVCGEGVEIFFVFLRAAAAVVSAAEDELLFTC